MEADRKRFTKRFIVAIDVCAAVAASAAVVAGYLVPHWFGDVDARGVTLSLARSETKLVFACGLGVLALNFLYLLYGRRLASPLRFVTSEVQGGPVRVAREAIEAGLRHAGESLTEVARLRVALEHGGIKRILARVQFQAPEGTSVHEATRALRHALDQRFTDMVHLGEGARIDWEIEFVGFVPLGKTVKKPAPLIQLDRADEAFTGPRYPIDDDEPHGERDEPYGGRKRG